MLSAAHVSGQSEVPLAWLPQQLKHTWSPFLLDASCVAWAVGVARDSPFDTGVLRATLTGREYLGTKNGLKV